jgi:RNA polymerase sigma factor (sigma-70 family)
MWAILGPLYETRWDDTVRRVGQIVGTWAAEDVAQDAFLRVAQAIEDGRADNPEAVLATTALRLALDYIRDEAWEEAMELNKISDRLEAPAFPADAGMFGAGLNDALDAMPDDYRSAWILTELRGLSGREAGALLGIDQSTVSRRSEMARRYIVKELSE